MLAQSGIRRCPAVRVSVVALDLVVAAGEHGAPARVHSSFRSAVNIRTSHGLLTLATPATGGLPNGVLLDLDDLRPLMLRPGMLVRPMRGGLSIPSAGVEIDLAAAQPWSPRMAPLPQPEHALARWRARSAAAWQAARLTAPRGGLRPLLWMADRSTATRHRDPLHDSWLSRARTALDRLARAITDADRAAATEAARALIGLGEGGTPSGDDALVAVEAVLHALGDPLAGFLKAALADVEARTSTVSACQLQHAALGEFAQRVQDLVRSFLARDDDQFGAVIADAARWGASSGADGVLGALRALDALADRSTARRLPA